MEPPALAAGPAAPVRAAPGARAYLVLPTPRGTQPFTYHWSRAGASLDDRFATSEDAGGVRLTVSAAQTGDSGVYTLQASNAAGSDTSKIRLEVSAEETPTGEDPPSFIRRLQDLTVKVGSRTRFLVEIISSTECKVTWYRNERRLLEAERVALARDGNFWCADVAAVSVDDAGRWTCTAENAGGRASCSAHLNVLVPKAYKRPEFVEELRALLTEQGTVSLECKVVGVPTPMLRWFKDSREIKAGDVFALTANAEDPTSLGTYTCEAVNCMGRAYSSSKVHVVGRASREGSAWPTSSVTPEPPPIFTKELEDAHVKVCDHLTLGCHIVVPPWPRSVVWYNKEGKVEPGERYHVLEDGVGGYLLEMQSAEWADEGEWKCVATSAGGRVGISTCHVTMDVPKNYRKPRFMENLQAVLTEEGLVSFECKVVGFPTPVLSWFKDGQELKPGDVYQLTGTNSLGSYCCIARNCMGQASSSAELTIEDIQNQLNEEEKLQLFSKNQAPKFIQGLKSVEAKIDEPFRFTVKVAIPPEPSVLWYRDDQPVDESTRCHLDKEDKGLFNLDIQNLEFLDQAEWKCVAMNDFGHSVTSCFLKLIIPRHFKKPRFLENLQAILSEEGAVNLECKVIGVPQPILKWYKDGEELKPGDIHRIISGQDGTCCLGTYTCEAQNCMGIAASSASLLGFDDSMKSKTKKIEEQPLQRNLSLSTIHEERTSQMYDTPVGDITLDDKGEISFSFDGKEVSVSLYETPDLTEEEALQIVEMYADQLSENVTEHNVVELPPLRFVKETSTSGNLLMEAIIIDVSPDYFAAPEEDLRTEADVEDLSIADDNGPLQLSLDQDIEIGGEDYLEKTMALLTEEKSDYAAKSSRKKSDSQRSADDFFSLSRDQSLSEEKRDDDTHISESELQSFASARSSAKVKSKSSKPSGEEGQESSEPTKTILLKEEIDSKFSNNGQLDSVEQELEVPVIKPKRENRTNRGSRRSSTSSEKSLSKSKEELLRVKKDVELPPKKPSMNDEEFKNTMSNMSTSLTKVINDVQLIERDIILKSELMSSAATASRSLEIISSLITPLSEIHSIAVAARESVSESREVTSTIFNTITQPLKVLQQSLTILEKCIDMESDNKTLVKKTCVAFIETCGTEVQKVLSDIKSVLVKDYILTEEIVVSEIDSITFEINTVIKFSTETIMARNLLAEASEIKPEEPTLETKHIRNTQKAVFELKSPLHSLLRIVESAESEEIPDLAKIQNSEVIMNDMSASIQDLQTALEQIESLSVTESSSTLQKYNTEIIETVMDSVLKLRSSFELLSTDPNIEEDKTVLKQTLSLLKENLTEISHKIHVVDKNVGQFDVLQNENKLGILQKMAQILIALENNIPRLEAMPEVKSHLGTFHKNLTKVLEKVIESNDAKKYIMMMEVCDTVNIINSSIKNLDSENVLPLASLYNTFKIINTHFVEHIFESELNRSIMNNVSDILMGIAEAINKAEELSLQIDTEIIQDFSTQIISEAKVNIILEHIDKTIAAVNTIKTIESTQELKVGLKPVLKNICPILEELRRSIASVRSSGVEQDEHVSDISEASFTQTFAIPMCELNQNIIVFNQLIVENIDCIKENTEIITAIAEPLHELFITLEILQQDVISQYGDDLTPYEVSVNMASVVQNLQSCIVMIYEQAGVEGADEMSTLEDISGIKTTADTLPSDHLLLPTASETAIEQSLALLTQEIATTATAQTLQTLNEHIMVMQTPEIIEALDTLSEVCDYSSLKSVVVSLAELQTGLQGILHPLPMEGSIDLDDLANTSKLAAIAEPMQEVQQSLSVLDSCNIPIYENILDLPTEKIHSVFQSISEFKNSLEKCMCAVLPAMEITNSTIEISNKVSTLREVCEQLKEIFETSKDAPGDIALLPEIQNLETVVDSLIGATDAKDIKIDQVKCITEELYLKFMEVQEDIIQFTVQSPAKISQEAKLIQIVSEVETNIAVLEQYDFINLSQASDMTTTCVSPQIAMEIDSESLAQIHDIAENAVNILHDSCEEIPIADLMIVEDFFKTCKNEFTIMRCLILKAISHKKIIRLLQEFTSLQTMINNFTTNRLELRLSDDVNECLTNFLIHADECLRNARTSLVKVIDSQSDMLIKTPVIQIESINDLKYLIESKTNIVLANVIKTLLDVVDISKSLSNHLQNDIMEEISQPTQISTPNQDQIVLSEKIEELATIVDAQLESFNLDESPGKVLKKLETCINKHHNYKDASGTGKLLIILKCLAECVIIVHEDITEQKMSMDETMTLKVKENSLKEVLVEMLQPLQVLQAQLVSIREQVLSGAEENSISMDITTTESIMLTMTEFHKDIVQQIELDKSTVDDEDISLIMEVDKEIHIIQDNIKSMNNFQAIQSVMEIAKPIDDIEKSLQIVLSSTKDNLWQEILPKETATQLLYHIDQYIELIEIVEQISAVIKVERVEETLNIARELRGSIATSENIPTNEQSRESIGSARAEQTKLAQKFQMALSALQVQVLDNAQELAPALKANALQRFAQVTAQLQANLVAVTGVQIYVQAPHIEKSNAVETAQEHFISAKKIESVVADIKNSIDVEQVYVLDKYASEKQVEVTTELLENYTAISQDVVVDTKLLQQKKTDDAPAIFPLHSLAGTEILCTEQTEDIETGQNVKEYLSTKTDNLEITSTTEKKVAEVVNSKKLDTPQQSEEKVAKTLMSLQENLMHHISEYVSEDITEVVTELSSVMNAEALNVSVNIANELRENIAALEIAIKEEIVDEIKHLQERQIELTQGLQTALSVLDGQTFENLHELIPSIDIGTIEKLVKTTKTLKSDLATAIMSQQEIGPIKHELQAVSVEVKTKIETAQLLKDVTETFEQAKILPEGTKRVSVEYLVQNIPEHNANLTPIESSEVLTESTSVCEEAIARQHAQVDEKKSNIAKEEITAEHTATLIEGENLDGLQSQCQQINLKIIDNASATKTTEISQQVTSVTESNEELLAHEADKTQQDIAVATETTENMDEIKVSLMSGQLSTLESSLDSFDITNQKMPSVAVTSDIGNAGAGDVLVDSHQIVFSDENAEIATEVPTGSKSRELVIKSAQLSEKSAEDLTTETLLQNTNAFICDDNISNTMCEHPVNINDLKLKVLIAKGANIVSIEHEERNQAELMIENNHKDDYKETKPVSSNHNDQLVEIPKDQSLTMTDKFINCPSEPSDDYKVTVGSSSQIKNLVTKVPKTVLTETTNSFEDFFDSATLADKLSLAELVATEIAEVTILEHPQTTNSFEDFFDSATLGDILPPVELVATKITEVTVLEHSQSIEKDIETTELSILDLSDSFNSPVVVKINVREATEMTKENGSTETADSTSKIETPLLKVAISCKVDVEDITTQQEHNTQENSTMCHDAKPFLHDIAMIYNETEITSLESLELASSENNLAETTKANDKIVALVAPVDAEVLILEHATNIEIEQKATEFAISDICDNLTSASSDIVKVAETLDIRDDEDSTSKLNTNMQGCVSQESVAKSHDAEMVLESDAVLIGNELIMNIRQINMESDKKPAITELVLHIDAFISDEVTEIVNEISNLTNTEALRESIVVAQKLRESIIATDCSITAEETSNMNESKHLERAYLAQTLQEALSTLHTQALDSAQVISSFISADALQKVSETISNLQEGLTTEIVFKESEKMLEQTDDVNLEIMEQDSITQLETLLQDINLKINFTSAEKTTDDDDSESLKDTLDEVQTVIIKMKREYDGAANDTLNETLEDLECSVRSVQLQINEEGPQEIITEACATLQLLVDSINASQQVSQTPFKSENTENILEKCSTETEETVKLLDGALKLDTQEIKNLTSIIINLNTIRNGLKVLQENFLDAETVIENGIKVVQCLDQIEDNIFSLERELESAVNITTDTRDIIITAIHSVYGSISNMRSTVSSVQKRYMFENYGKPSESLLHSIKNIVVISRSDSKENKVCWIKLSKSLRKVLNHFEDIKFYINLDKTARLPSDAAFTKIILEELKGKIFEILVPRAMLLHPNVSLKVKESLKCIEKILIDIESDLSLEVKNKIPMFKEISTKMLIATNLVKKHLEKTEDVKANITAIGLLNIIKLENEPSDKTQELQKLAVTTEKQQAESIAEMAKDKKSESIKVISITEIGEAKKIAERVPSTSNNVKDEDSKKSVRFMTDADILHPPEKQDLLLEVKPASKKDFEEVTTANIGQNETQTITHQMGISKLDQAQILKDLVGIEPDNNHDLTLLPTTTEVINKLEIEIIKTVESPSGNENKIKDTWLEEEEAKCESKDKFDDRIQHEEVTAEKAECSTAKTQVSHTKENKTLTRNAQEDHEESSTIADSEENHNQILNQEKSRNSNIPSNVEDGNASQKHKNEIRLEENLKEDLEVKVEMGKKLKDEERKHHSTTKHDFGVLEHLEIQESINEKPVQISEKSPEELAHVLEIDSFESIAKDEMAEHQRKKGQVNKEHVENQEEIWDSAILKTGELAQIKNEEEIKTQFIKDDEIRMRGESSKKIESAKLLQVAEPKQSKNLKVQNDQDKCDRENDEKQTEIKQKIDITFEKKQTDLLSEEAENVNKKLKDAKLEQDIDTGESNKKYDFDQSNQELVLSQKENEVNCDKNAIESLQVEKETANQIEEIEPCGTKQEHILSGEIKIEAGLESEEAKYDAELKENPENAAQIIKKEEPLLHTENKDANKVKAIPLQKMDEEKITQKKSEESQWHKKKENDVLKHIQVSKEGEELMQLEEETLDKREIDETELKHKQEDGAFNNASKIKEKEDIENALQNTEINPKENVSKNQKHEIEFKQKHETLLHTVEETKNKAKKAKNKITIENEQKAEEKIKLKQEQEEQQEQDCKIREMEHSEIKKTDEVCRAVSEKAKMERDKSELKQHQEEQERVMKENEQTKLIQKEEETRGKQERDEAELKQKHEDITRAKKGEDEAHFQRKDEQDKLKAETEKKEEDAKKLKHDAELKQKKQEEAQFKKEEENCVIKEKEDHEQKEKEKQVKKELANKANNHSETAESENKERKESELKQQQVEKETHALKNKEEEAHANNETDEVELKQKQKDIARAKKEENDACFEREKEDIEITKPKTEIEQKEYDANKQKYEAESKQEEEAQFKKEEENRLQKEKEDAEQRELETRVKKEKVKKAKKDTKSCEVKENKEREESVLKQNEEEKNQAALKEKEEEARSKKEMDEAELKQKQKNIELAKKEEDNTQRLNEYAEKNKLKAEIEQTEQDVKNLNCDAELKLNQEKEAQFKKKVENPLPKEKEDEDLEKNQARVKEEKVKKDTESAENEKKEKEEIRLKQEQEKKQHDELKQKEEEARAKQEKEDADKTKLKVESIQKENDATKLRCDAVLKEKQEEEAKFKEKEKIRLRKEKEDSEQKETQARVMEENAKIDKESAGNEEKEETEEATCKQKEEEARTKQEINEAELKQKQEDIECAKKEKDDTFFEKEKENAIKTNLTAEIEQHEIEAKRQKHQVELKQKQEEKTQFEKEAEHRLQQEKEDSERKEKEALFEKEKAKKTKNHTETTEKENKGRKESELKLQQAEKEQTALKKKEGEARAKQERDEVEHKQKQINIEQAKKEEENASFEKEKEDAEKTKLKIEIEQKGKDANKRSREAELRQKQEEEAQFKMKEESRLKKEQEDAEERELEARVKKEAVNKAKTDTESCEVKEKKDREESEFKQQQEKKEQTALIKKEDEARAKQERDEAGFKQKQENIERAKKEEDDARCEKEKEDVEKIKLKIEIEQKEKDANKRNHEAELKQKQEEEAQFKKEEESRSKKEQEVAEERELEAQVKKEEAKEAKTDTESCEVKEKKDREESEFKQQQEKKEQAALIKKKDEARANQERDEAELKQKQENIERAKKEEDDARFEKEKEDAKKTKLKIEIEQKDKDAKKRNHEAELKQKQEEEALFKKEEESCLQKEQEGAEERELEARIQKEEANKAKTDIESCEVKEKKDREESEFKKQQEKKEQAALIKKEDEARVKQERDEAELKQKQENIERAKKEEDDARCEKEKEDVEKTKLKIEIEQKEKDANKRNHEAELKQKQEEEAQFKKDEETRLRKEKEDSKRKEKEARVKKEKVKKAKNDTESYEIKEKKEREESELKLQQEERDQNALKKKEDEARSKQERDEAELKQKQENIERAKNMEDNAYLKDDTEKTKLKAEIEQNEKGAKRLKHEVGLKQKQDKAAPFEKEEENCLQNEEIQITKEKAKNNKEIGVNKKKETEESKLKQQLKEQELAMNEKIQANLKEKEEDTCHQKAKNEQETVSNLEMQENIKKNKRDKYLEKPKKEQESAELYLKQEKTKVKKENEIAEEFNEVKQEPVVQEKHYLEEKEVFDFKQKQEETSSTDTCKAKKVKIEKGKLKELRAKNTNEDKQNIEVQLTNNDFEDISKKATKYTEVLDKRERRDDELHIYKQDSDRENKENGDINLMRRRDVSHEQHYIREYQFEPSQAGHKLEAREKPKFIDHNHRDYTMEFARPSGYRERSFDFDKIDTLPTRDHLGKNIAIFRAQTIVLDSQLRSSAPPYPDTSSLRTPEPTDRYLEIRNRSKALSEARSVVISEKRTALTRDSKRKPVFSTYLTDRTAVEGSRVKLTCSVLSSTDPTVTWYKNGVLLDNKLKYRTKFMDGLITLEVLNAVPSDSAEYSCTIVNANGSVSSSAILKVYPSFEASPIPPTFTRSIRDNYHLAENELVLECRIRGQPLPTITWLKDDKSISTNSRYQAYYLADGVCRLAIEHPTPEDSGKYTCKAENSVWSDQITHLVNFTGRESCLSPNIATKEKSRFNRQAMESRRPHFTNVLSDYKVVQGGTIGLQVEIRGAPTSVEWLREGCSVTEVYRNAKTFVEHGLYTLALSDVTEKESGMYTCRAWSSQCHVDMNAAITVVQPNELDGKPAIIVGRPEKDILISVGEDVNISFRVQGEPRPKVVFMKGIRDITTNQRVCKMTSDDYVKFTLKRSVVSDAGTYCILARNAYGCDRAFVTVVVRQRASSDNLISDWTYPTEDSTLSIADRKYKSVPERIPGVPSVVEGGNNWISLGWPKSEPGSSAPVLAYKVESWLLGKEGGARWVELGITPLTSFDAFNLKQGEEYHFRVTPRNRYGWGESIQTSSPIGVGLAGDRPEFSEYLPGQLKVLVGETANLTCSVKGKPVPEVVWMKNGHEVEDEDRRLSSSFNGFNCCLTIKDINIEDEARYSCEATNVHGRASTYARLAVVTDRSIWEADAKLKRERSADVEGDYPPQFTMRLRDRRVQATYPVRLTCQVIGSPDPGITWFKDGEDVKADSRRSHFQDEHFHTLEIAPTTLEDGGVYEAMARNSSGAVSCRCSLVVDKGIRAYVAPEFCCGLEPLYRLTDGEELRISAVVEAYPSVGVTWYRDGVRLRPSRRAIMTLDRDGQIELALAAVTSRDAGVYTCTASNEVGRASTSGKVEVSGTGVKPSLPVFISPDEPYSKEPMFIRKPRSSEAREGDTVIIACEVVGDPKPDVYWLRDFLKPDYYRDSSHFKRMGDGPEYRFEIPHAKLDYTGAYSVVARNQHGEAKAVISLQILAKDPTSSDETHNVRYGRVEVLPRFVKELTDLLSCDGDVVQFECRLTSHPEPNLRWYHYNELIRDCPDFETSFDDGTARLKIKQVTAEDEGTYTCEAANNLGKATSSACLVVYPPGEPNILSQRLRRPPAFLSAASTPRSTPRSTPARSVSRTPGPETRRLCSPARTLAPSFYTYPFNKVAEEGDSVTLQCAIKGNPAPWATWDKDGVIITPSSRITIKEKDDVLRVLEIDQVTVEDVGVYRITIENEFGRQEASARIEVITQRGKFYAGVRAVSPSPRKSLTYRGRRPSTPGKD